MSAITETIKFHDGREFTITLDEDYHIYSVDHTEALPLGVTTPVDSMLRGYFPEGAWYAKEMYLHMEAAMRDFTAPDEWDVKQIRVPEDEFLKILNDAKFAAKRKSEEAKEIGTQVHAFAETFVVKGMAAEPEHPTAIKCCAALVEWLGRPGRRVISAERLVFSPTHFFAGKADRLDEVDGELEIVDFKTSSRFSVPSMPIQLSGYAIALEEELGTVINRGRIVRIDKVTGLVEERAYELNEHTKECFVRILNAYKQIEKVKGLYNASRKQAA